MDSSLLRGGRQYQVAGGCPGMAVLGRCTMSLLRSLGARAEQCALRITRCNPAVYPTFYCQGAYPVIDTGDWKQPEYTVVHKLGIVKSCWAVSEV